MSRKSFFTLYNYKTYSNKNYDTREELRSAIMDHLRDKLKEIEILEDWDDLAAPIELEVEINFTELKDD